MTTCTTASVHPMIWAREHGAGRVVYDGLGHDARSYDSGGIGNCCAARWTG